MLDSGELPAAIAAFDAARRRGEYFPRAYEGRLSLDDAYRILLGVARLRAASGDPRVGWKVGLTARAIQEQFGFHEPVFACLFASGRIDSGHRFAHAELIRPGFENEICFELAETIDPGWSLERIGAAARAIRPALEIIETRGDFTRHVALAMADNGQQKAFVIGPAVPFRDLREVTARVSINDVEVATGQGAAVLGDPRESIRWLAGKLAHYGERIAAGDYVMAGSFTRQFPIAAGDRVRTTFDGVGQVAAVFAA